ncbi:anthranilate synthase component I [Deltaproteobacteria bacterium Smac51]|nr:anthranilate synthase component I [Deltaproteobacteria bacterium Smac51]
MNITLKQTALEMDSDLETVISLFMGRIGQRDGILLESAEVDGRWGRFSLAAGDFLLLARNSGGRLELDINDQRLAPLAEYAGMSYMEGLRKVMDAVHIEPVGGAAEFPPITRALYGYLDYDASALMEPKLNKFMKFDRGAEGGFCLAGNVYLFDHTYNRLIQLTLLENSAQTALPSNGTRPMGRVTLGPEESSFTSEGYMKAVEDIRELIRQGECIQVVLSNRFSAPFTGDLFDVYRRLRRINPSPYMFYLNFPEISLAVSSPEVMVSCDKGRLRLCPIAGTRPRGETLQQDSLFEEELQSDPKEQAEHVMLVDLGRNDLGRVAAPGTVKVERFMETERFSHVMHLTSHLSAQLEDGRHPVDVIAATFPAGTLSGAPKVRAMEIISQYEPCPRGPYGGAMGWLGLDKDAVSLDLGITIRGLWRKNGQVFWQAGAGLVFDSDPEREWKECLQKSMAPRTALEAAAGGE